LTRFKVLSSSSFHYSWGAPEMNQSPPLSASNMPYFLRPFKITCADAGN
jgi:hypothetical protein